MPRKNKTFIVIACLFLIPAVLCAQASSQSEVGKNTFDVITISSPITPPIAGYITKSIDQSAGSGAAGLIILMDTPGGLDVSMRDIIKAMLGSKVPVIVYVYPSGSRAASAGAIITVAAHVAAMTPGTNIGAAHPVSIGFGKMDEAMVKKAENDAVAYARGIALKRGHNVDWVERAIRKSESTTAEDALKLGVIDFVAANPEKLLELMDGKKVSLPSGEVTLHTKGAKLNYKQIGLRQKILMTISDPNIAYLLFLLGLAGLYFEFSNPGAVLPGIIGGISLILSFFALQTMPVNYAGVLLILFAVILFIAEIKVMSHGILTVGGIISLLLGSLMLFESPEPALRVSLKVMLPAVAVVSLFFVAVISLAVRAQLRQPRTGKEGMLGLEGDAITDVFKSGKVYLNGEYWNASSDHPIEKGTRIKVIDVQGLNLVIDEIK